MEGSINIKRNNNHKNILCTKRENKPNNIEKMYFNLLKNSLKNDDTYIVKNSNLKHDKNRQINFMSQLENDYLQKKIKVSNFL